MFNVFILKSSSDEYDSVVIYAASEEDARSHAGDLINIAKVRNHVSDVEYLDHFYEEVADCFRLDLDEYELEAVTDSTVIIVYHGKRYLLRFNEPRRL